MKVIKPSVTFWLFFETDFGSGLEGRQQEFTWRHTPEMGYQTKTTSPALGKKKEHLYPATSRVRGGRDREAAGGEGGAAAAETVGAKAPESPGAPGAPAGVPTVNI